MASSGAIHAGSRCWPLARRFRAGEVFASARRRALPRADRARNGHEGRGGFLIAIRKPDSTGPDLGFLVGAGEGNRTLMTSLEGWGSAIELRPHGGHARQPGETVTRVAYRPRANLVVADETLSPGRLVRRQPDRGRGGARAADGKLRLAYRDVA